MKNPSYSAEGVMMNDSRPFHLPTTQGNVIDTSKVHRCRYGWDDLHVLFSKGKPGSTLVLTLLEDEQRLSVGGFVDGP